MRKSLLFIALCALTFSIDNAGFSIIGPYEKEQFFGDEITLFLE